MNMQNLDFAKKCKSYQKKPDSTVLTSITLCLFILLFTGFMCHFFCSPQALVGLQFVKQIKQDMLHPSHFPPIFPVFVTDFYRFIVLACDGWSGLTAREAHAHAIKCAYVLEGQWDPPLYYHFKCQKWPCYCLQCECTSGSKPPPPQLTEASWKMPCNYFHSEGPIWPHQLIAGTELEDMVLDSFCSGCCNCGRPGENSHSPLLWSKQSSITSFCQITYASPLYLAYAFFQLWGRNLLFEMECCSRKTKVRSGCCAKEFLMFYFTSVDHQKQTQAEPSSISRLCGLESLKQHLWFLKSEFSGCTQKSTLQEAIWLTKIDQFSFPKVTSQRSECTSSYLP